jgi:hypothetical protein
MPFLLAPFILIGHSVDRHAASPMHFLGFASPRLASPRPGLVCDALIAAIETISSVFLLEGR